MAATEVLSESINDEVFINNQCNPLFQLLQIFLNKRKASKKYLDQPMNTDQSLSMFFTELWILSAM